MRTAIGRIARCRSSEAATEGSVLRISLIQLQGSPVSAVFRVQGVPRFLAYFEMTDFSRVPKPSRAFRCGPAAREVLGIACASLLALVNGCSSAHEARPGADDGLSTRPAGSASSTTTCESWAVRECGIELGTHDGVVECARGTQICDSGHWGSCLADASKKTTSVRAPTAASGLLGARGLLSIGGSSTTCKDNPCNPYCQVFADVPDAAIQADGSTVTFGDAAPGPSLANSNVPSGIGNKGNDPNAVCTPGCTSQACMQA